MPHRALRRTLHLQVPLDEPSNMDRDQQPDEPFNMELEQQPDLADLEAPARTGTPLAAVTPQAAAQRTSYQGAWNKTKTGIAEKDTEALYECMAEIGELILASMHSSSPKQVNTPGKATLLPCLPLAHTSVYAACTL